MPVFTQIVLLCKQETVLHFWLFAAFGLGI